MCWQALLGRKHFYVLAFETILSNEGWVHNNGPLFLNHYLKPGFKRLRTRPLIIQVKNMLILEQCGESKAEIEKASRKGFTASSIPTDSLFNNLHLNNLLWQYYNKCAGGGIDRSASLFLHSYTPSEQSRVFCKSQVLTNFSLNGFIFTKKYCSVRRDYIVLLNINLPTTKSDWKWSSC